MRKNILLPVFLVLFLLVLTGCGYYNTFYNAKKYFEKNDYKTSLEKCDKILSKDKYRTLHDDALFLKARIYQKTGEGKKAVEYYSMLLNRADDSAYTEQAREALFTLYVSEGDYQNAYTLYSRIREKERTPEMDLIFAKLLYLLQYTDELSSLAQNYGTTTDTGREIALYAALSRGERDEAGRLLKAFESPGRGRHLARIFFLMTCDPFFAPFMSPEIQERYRAPLSLLVPGGGTGAFQAVLDQMDGLAQNEQQFLLRGLFRLFVERGRFYEAKMALLKMDTLSGARASSVPTMALVMNTNKPVAYSDLPANWKGYLTDGRNHYLYTDEYEIYQLVRGRWEKSNAALPPEGIEEYTTTVWDALNKRWLFIAEGKDEWYALNIRDFSWDTVLLEGDDFPRILPERLYYYNRKLFYFAGIGSFYVGEIRGSDKINVEEIEVKGWLPQISGYTVLDFTRLGRLVLVGGKEGDINNTMAFTLDITDPNPSWKEQYAAAPVVLADYVLTSFNAGRYKILLLWDPLQEYKEPAKALLADFQSSTGRLTLVDVPKAPEVVKDFFEYEIAGENGNDTIIVYRDPNTSFNSLLLTIMFTNVRQQTLNDDFRMGNEPRTEKSGDSVQDILLQDPEEEISPDELLPVINALDQLHSMKESRPRKAGDLYLDAGFYEKAAESYRKALENEPGDNKLLYALAYIHYRYLKDPEASRDYLGRIDISSVEEALLREHIMKLQGLLQDQGK